MSEGGGKKRGQLRIINVQFRESRREGLRRLKRSVCKIKIGKKRGIWRERINR